MKIKKYRLLGVLILFSVIISFWYLPHVLGYTKVHRSGKLELDQAGLESWVELVTYHDYNPNNGYITVQPAVLEYYMDRHVWERHEIQIEDGNPLEWQLGPRKIKTQASFLIFFHYWSWFEGWDYEMYGFTIITVAETRWVFEQYTWQWSIFYTDTCVQWL